MYLDLIDPLSRNSMSCHDRIMTNQNPMLEPAIITTSCINRHIAK